METGDVILIIGGIALIGAGYYLYTTLPTPSPTPTPSPSPTPTPSPTPNPVAKLSITPNPITASTTTIIASGVNFNPGTTVTFTANSLPLTATTVTSSIGSFALDFTYPGSGQLDQIIDILEETGGGTLTMTANDGSSLSSATVAVAPSTIITTNGTIAVSPDTFNEVNGTIITITGTGYGSGATGYVGAQGVTLGTWTANSSGTWTYQATYGGSSNLTIACNLATQMGLNFIGVEAYNNTTGNFSNVVEVFFA